MEYTEFLYRALEAPLGIKVTTNDPEGLRQKLYAARSKAQNPDFEALTFSPSRSKPQSELWIIRRT